MAERVLDLDASSQSRLREMNTDSSLVHDSGCHLEDVVNDDNDMSMFAVQLAVLQLGTGPHSSDSAISGVSML